MKITKILVLFAAMTLAAGSTFAQDFSFGAKFGVNFSKFNEDIEDETNKSKAGIQLGMYADCAFNDMFAVEAGLQFEQKGGKTESADRYEVWSNTTNLNYLTVPVNLRVNLPVGDHNLYFLAGPTFGIALSGKDKNEDEDGTTKTTLKLGSSKADDYKRMNVGLLFGAGFELSQGVGIRFTYDIGLSNLDEDTRYKCKTGVFGMAVTYKF